MFTCVRGERIGQPPGQDFAGCPIHNSDQIEEAVPHWNIGYVAAPDLVGARDWQTSKQLGIDRVLRVFLAGVAAFEYGLQPPLIDCFAINFRAVDQSRSSISVSQH